MTSGQTWLVTSGQTWPVTTIAIIATSSLVLTDLSDPTPAMEAGPLLPAALLCFRFVLLSLLLLVVAVCALALVFGSLLGSWCLLLLLALSSFVKST